MPHARRDRGWRARDADKAGLVVGSVFHVCGEHRESVARGRMPARQRGPRGIGRGGDRPRRSRRVVGRVRLHQRMAIEEPSALLQRHGVTFRRADAGQARAGHAEHAVMDRDDGLGNDARALGVKQPIVGVGDRARDRILDGEDPGVDVARRDGAHHVDVSAQRQLFGAGPER